MSNKLRQLADDLMLRTMGPRDGRTRAVSKQRVHVAFEFLQDMGAKVSPTKCLTFANHRDARSDLKREHWGPQRFSIPSAADHRDLGAHFDTTARRVASTLSARLRRATGTARFIQALPIDAARKAKLVKGKALPMALYGCEVSSLNGSLLNTFSTAVQDCLANRNRLRAEALTYEAAGPVDIDPRAVALVRRWQALRRN